MKSPSKGGSKARVFSEGLPLLDEVNELIEKERLLLSLKVLEQEKAAQEWKAKYDTLVGKVAETSHRTGDFRAMELLATGDVTADGKTSSSSSSFSSSSTSYAGGAEEEKGSWRPGTATAPPATPEGVQALLSSLKHPWVLDLASCRTVKTALMTQINNDAFSLRTATALKVALLSRCGITDECAAALGTLLSRPALEALDLSFNELGSGTVQQLAAGLRQRRRTPQYLRLHGNTAMSSAAAPVASLLPLLTDSTWGLSVSLQDLSNAIGVASAAAPARKRPVSAAEEKKSAKDAKDAKDGKKARPPLSINDLYDPSKHPSLTLDFLTQLLALVDPTSTQAQAKGKAAAKKVRFVPLLLLCLSSPSPSLPLSLTWHPPTPIPTHATTQPHSRQPPPRTRRSRRARA